MGNVGLIKVTALWKCFIYPVILVSGAYIFDVALGFNAKAQAQALSAYPQKPLRLVVPFAPGGTADLLGRFVAQMLSSRYRQSVVVDNKGGAGGALGSDIVAKSNPDGYSIILSNAASHASVVAINKKLPYDALHDFSHAALICVIPQTFVVNKDFPATQLDEFIAYAKHEPGKLSYGTAGMGSMGHFSGELLKVLAGIQLTHVAYKGTAPASIDLIANRVQAMFQNGPESQNAIRNGLIRLLAVTGEKRSLLFPDTPTFVESGFKHFVSYTWYGLSFPRATPEPIVQLLNQSVNQALAEPSSLKRLSELGVEPRAMSVRQYTQFVATEIAKFRDIAQRANILAPD